MADKKILNTKKIFKTALIVYAVLFAVGIIMTAIFGVKLDINFSGGTRISYSYTGKLDESVAKKAVKEAINEDFKFDTSTSIAGDTKTMTISLAGRKSLSADKQASLTTALQEALSENKVVLYNSNSVSPSVAGNFLVKSLVAVLITAVLVVLYVTIRFKKIGGFSAALTALCALVLDILVSFFICVIFRLEIDSNYMAVVLTLLGYSLNDTIVVYDRIRENHKLYPQNDLSTNVDLSISGVITRNIVTTVTTVLAVITIIVVSEIFGLTSLRTFAIPMVFGLASGCVSSLFIASPLWAIWKGNKKKA